MWTNKAKGGRMEMALKYEGPKMSVLNCPKDLTKGHVHLVSISKLAPNGMCFHDVVLKHLKQVIHVVLHLSPNF
jgi:hypothetical protein